MRKGMWILAAIGTVLCIAATALAMAGRFPWLLWPAVLFLASLMLLPLSRMAAARDFFKEQCWVLWVMTPVLFVIALTCAVLFFTADGHRSADAVPAEPLAGQIQDRSVAEDMAILRAFFSAVNARDIDGYIGLFSAEIQDDMCGFISMNGREQFFSETRELCSVSAVTDSYIAENAWLFEDVRSLFDGFCAYYVTEAIRFDEETEVRQSGIQTNLYVIVLEGGARVLYRVSASPPINAAHLERVPDGY